MSIRRLAMTLLTWATEVYVCTDLSETDRRSILENTARQLETLSVGVSASGQPTNAAGMVGSCHALVLRMMENL